jgi:excisionase family DNA binding protein
MGDDALQADAVTLLTVTQAAQQTGISRHIISSWITRGLLPAVRIDSRRYIRPVDLAATQATAHLGEVRPAWRQTRRHAATRLRVLR